MLTGTITADAQDAVLPEGSESEPVAPPPDAEGGWGLLWAVQDGVRTSSVVIHSYGSGTETELWVRVFRAGEVPEEWVQGSYPDDGTDQVVGIGLSSVVGSSLAAVSVVANAYRIDDGTKLGSHGVEGYAYVDSPGSVAILSEAEASERVVALAAASDDGFVEVPELLGREVAR